MFWFQSKRFRSKKVEKFGTNFLVNRENIINSLNCKYLIENSVIWEALTLISLLNTNQQYS